MGRYITVTGGQLYNKGAQAMVFITVDEMAKRYPDREVVLLSNMDNRRNSDEKKKYKFKIQGYPKPIWLFLMQTHFGRLLSRIFGGKSAGKFIALMENTDAIVDVSGYSLGSDWGYKKSVFYLTRLGIARSMHVPVYLMPQSFGPFNYKGFGAPFLNRMLRKNMSYAEIILCREKEGYKLLKEKYNLTNVSEMSDLVLQNTGVNWKNIYRSEPEMIASDIPEHSVAVIPNKKTMLYGDSEKLFELYHVIAETLLNHGVTVYLMYHSSEDMQICKDIKNRYFKSENSVRFVDMELSCLEFDELVRQFDFVIASRFHAIVHSYRNAVPAIVLGWAVKYKELLSRFSQQEFQFDVRGYLDSEHIISMVLRMCGEYRQHSEEIEKELCKIRQENAYDKISI